MITQIRKTIETLLKQITLRLTGVISLVAFVMIFPSCEKNVTVDIPVVDSKIVVEGYVETGQNPIVILSKTLPFFGSVNTLDLLQYTIKGAVVTVSNGTITDTLRDFFNLGIYFSTMITGVPGESYSLRVVVDGTVVTARTAIPFPVHLDSTWFKVDGNRDSLGFAWAHFKDPDTLGNCYRWFAKRINHYKYGELAGKMKDTTFVTPRGSVFEDKFINGRSFDFGYNRGSLPNSTKDDDNNDERNFFKRGDTIVIKFCAIDREHFEFWRTEESQVGSNGNPFASAAPVKSNIQGGVGIWGGYATTFDTIIAH